ncbi:MAG: aminopeptidase P family protein [Rhodospirillales bacterium]|jgi:Xaa-Pro aminopeptidase
MTPAGDIASRMKKLRKQMALMKLDALLVPSADAFQSEYVPASDRRLAWISGFTGSMGQAVILKNKAFLFVDGRYTLQAAKEGDPALYEIVPTSAQSLNDWLASRLKPGQSLGADPWLVSADGALGLEKSCAKANALLRWLEVNPIDGLWTDRPAPPASAAEAQPLAHAGESSKDKRARVAALLAREQSDRLLICAPDTLCWLLNIRGRDIPYAPLLRAFAILDRLGGVDLFLDHRRLDFFLDRDVRLHPPNSLLAHLKELGQACKCVHLDPKQTPLLLYDALKFSGARITEGADPCLRLKACKNKTEIEGARAAHWRDGRALIRTLHGLKAGMRESAAAELADHWRAREELAQGPSFATIAAAGANGAIVHYRARKGRDALLKAGQPFLLDSGGQYLDGTTDVTRTVFIGPGSPSPDMKRMFTLVLKGHIALASAVFPRGTTGLQLDALARQFLWQAGLDYDHGTGHGVGSYLSVHEGPGRIAKSGPGAALEEGMILSIEPGYYRPGAFGIRIESLGLVVPAAKAKGGEREMLRFEILTKAPIDLRLIAPRLLAKPERDWLNAYHLGIRKAFSGRLERKTQAWLERQTRPL